MRYTVTKANYRIYGKDGFASYTLRDNNLPIGYIDEYSKVVNRIIKQLNSGEIGLDKTGFKAKNDEFFTVCESCKNIHIDGTRNNCV